MAKRKTKKSNKKRVNESKKIETVNSFDTDIWSKIFVALGVICFLLVFYLLTLYITNKNSEDTKEDTEEEEVTVSNENIIVGRSLSMSDGEYLVIFYDKSDDDISSTYSSLVSTYKAKEEHLTIYTVDMSNGLNKSFITDKESNKAPTTESEISINGPTLMVVNNHAVSEYLEGEEAISNYLN